VVALETTKQ